MKVLQTLSIFILALAGFSLVAWGPWKPGRVDLSDEKGFFLDLLWELNQARDMAGQPDLLQDVHLQQWAGEVVRAIPEVENLRTEEILKLLERDVPSVATASVFVVYADSLDTLRKRFLEWGGELEGNHSHFSMRLFSNSDERGVGGLALMVRRLPRFQPSLLGKSPEAFYNVCPICDEAHHGKVNPIARSIVLECPKCDQRYDLLAVDLKGKYHRANSFLNGGAVDKASISGAGNGAGRREELFKNWERVLEHCRYVKDFAGINGRRDAWQFAEETERYRNGDCEDTSILLADWLISRGFDARVALGRTDHYEGHAWCVVRLDGVEYILETTEAKPDRSRPPTTDRLGGEYVPEFLFDRNSLYFRIGSKWRGDYWSNSNWVRVAHPAEESAALAALPGEDRDRRGHHLRR